MNLQVFTDSNERLKKLVWILTCHLYPDKQHNSVPIKKKNIQMVSIPPKIQTQLQNQQVALKKQYYA